MSLEMPQFPDKFDWPATRAVMEDWFFRFLHLQSLVPSGTICEFVGSAAPDGWVECDGTEYEISKFPVLASVVGVESSPDMFTVPDGSGSPPTLGAIWIIKV